MTTEHTQYGKRESALPAFRPQDEFEGARVQRPGCSLFVIVIVIALVILF